jgi:hypothetical protein
MIPEVVKSLVKSKAEELVCKYTHKLYDRETVSKCNTSRLEFTFEMYCPKCSRWLGKTPKTFQAGNEADGT